MSMKIFFLQSKINHVHISLSARKWKSSRRHIPKQLQLTPTTESKSTTDSQPHRQIPLLIFHILTPPIMDQPSSSLDQNVDLSKLSQKDKQELQQFIVNESQKARIQQCPSFLSFQFIAVSIRCLNCILLV
jgi:hypothetical protein